jgi:hypothetical protein
MGACFRISVNIPSPFPTDDLRDYKTWFTFSCIFKNGYNWTLKP